ncbi:MAG: hypothetical protein ACK4L4_20060, partial [Gemmobacter sp.]
MSNATVALTSACVAMMRCALPSSQPRLTAACATCSDYNWAKRVATLKPRFLSSRAGSANWPD